MTGGHDENLRLAADGGEIPRARVAHGKRRVSGKQHHRHRTADHETAPDHRRARALYLDAVVIQKFHHALRRAGGKALAAAREDGRETREGHAVHVLHGGERLADPPLVEMLRQRTEHEAAVDRVVRIDARDLPNDVRLRAVRGQHRAFRDDADGGAPALCRALIGHVVHALADAHHRKLRRDAARSQRLGARD